MAIPLRYRISNFFVYVAAAAVVVLSGVPFRPVGRKVKKRLRAPQPQGAIGLKEKSQGP